MDNAPTPAKKSPVKKKKRNDFQFFMDFVDKLVENVLIFMLISVLCCVWLQVLGRYLPFIKPFPWTEEIARWLLVWLTFLGASHVAKTSSFTRVDFFVRKTSKSIQKGLGIFTKICILAYTGWFSCKSLIVFTTVAVFERGPTTQLPMLLMRSAVFVGMAVTFLQMLSSGGIYLEEPEEEGSSV